VPPSREQPSLDHVVIAVSDWERSNAFYRDVLGVELVELDRGRFAYRLADGRQLNVHGPGSTPHPRALEPVRPGSSDLCFVWDGTAAEAAAHLEAHGVEVELGPVERPGARGLGASVYFRDPDGSLLELISYASMGSEAGNIWDDVPEWGGGIGARRLVRAPGGTLGASLWELAPGASQFVYHFHHGTEEFLVVLRGRPTVKMRDGDRELAEGDVVPFPRGPEGGHQIRNDGAEPARVLIVAANADPDVAEYPDTGKLAAIVHGEHRFHRVEDAVPHAGPE
jgi:uncharacterized cupin superfamily protein/catechol 2,3-dioxygenase-like lactoylglutathione lyase family enzyme